MQGNTGAGSDHLFETQAVFFSVPAFQSGVDDLPGFIFVSDKDRSGFRRIDVQSGLAGFTLRFGSKLRLNDIQKRISIPVQPGAVLEPV